MASPRSSCKQQFYFRVKPKETHFQTAKCNSDTISISSRSTKLFAYEGKSFQLKPPSQCKEYKSYLRRFNKTLSLSQQQAFSNFCEWKKKKLFAKYELQDSKSHKMITHILPYQQYTGSPIPIHPFPNNGLQFENDYKILKRNNQFYLLVTQNLLPVDKQDNKDTPPFDQPKQKCIAIDPGVNKFLTGYSPEGIVIEVGGQQLKDDLIELFRRQDQLSLDVKKRRDSIHAKKHLQRRRKRWHKLERQKQNRIRDFHWKTARFLLSRWETILYPTFNTKEMVKRIHSDTEQKRVISKQTTRLLGAMSHYKMKQRLAHKESEFSGSQTRICTEEFTSQTCANCFFVTGKLPYSNTFKCPKCGFQAPRDMISASLIYNLSATKKLPVPTQNI